MCVCTYIYIYIYISFSLSLCILVCTYIHIYVYKHMRACMCMCVYVYVCMGVCVYNTKELLLASGPSTQRKKRFAESKSLVKSLKSQFHTAFTQ